jgi:hypothetical protein
MSESEYQFAALLFYFYGVVYYSGFFFTEEWHRQGRRPVPAEKKRADGQSETAAPPWHGRPVGRE